MIAFKIFARYQFAFIAISIICLQKTANTSDCASKLSWTCDTDDQCIHDNQVCDGIVHCDDASDETVRNCIGRKCDAASFRCTYGACIAKILKCNGRKDCSDGSDELRALCKKTEWLEDLQGRCDESEMQCLDSGECITKENICNGQPKCKDASDESLSVCTAHDCSPTAFRCGYGGCVSDDVVCDGKEDCLDGADESPVMCKSRTIIKQTTTTTTTTTQAPLTPAPPTAVKPIFSVGSNEFCRIPSDNYLLIVRNAFTEVKIILGTYVPANQPVTFSCDTGYVLKGTNNSYCLGNDMWSQNLPGCYFYCSDKHPRSGFSTKVIFELDVDVSHRHFFEPGTIAKISCAYYYKKPRFFKEKLICKDHGWNTAKERCNMRCGEPSDQETKFSKGGVNTNITEVPWHVGIYAKSGDTYENICGGTLISPRVVVSAAHCFFEKERTKIDLSTYSIAAGKYYREYDRDELGIAAVEKRNIIDVWVHEDYNGAENGYYRDISIIKLDRFMTFSDTIRPACLHLPEEAAQNIPTDKQGRISAWGQMGIRGRESTLQTLHMGTVSYDQCSQTLAEKSFITLKGDKFCLASFGQEAFACKGDSGSGFVVRMPDKTFALWGVVSYSPSRTQDCSRDQLLVMTNALFYKSWLEDARKKDIDNDIDYETLRF